MDFESDDVMTYLDSWGIRRLFSLAVRRRGAARKVRDPVMEEFFHVMEAAWGKYVPKGRDRKGREVFEMDDDEQNKYVDPECLSDTEMSEALALHFSRAETDEYQTFSPTESPSKPKVAVVDSTPAPTSAPDVKASEESVEMDLDMEELRILAKLRELRPSEHDLLIAFQVGFL